MKYKQMDRVRIKSLDWYNNNNRDRIDEVACGNTNFIPDMVKYCEGIVTISSILPTLKVYHIKEDGGMFNWTDEMIEGLAEEETSQNAKLVSERFSEYVNPSEVKYAQDTITKMLLQGANIPNEYILKDENGNIINATKIVLEKKKKEYPKTYEECCEVLGYEDIATHCIFHTEADERLFDTLYSLKVCRDAYWKIAGEEMGLGKPWKPQEGVIYCYMPGAPSYIRNIFPFPTEEMRDAFKENFKEKLKFVKELL